MISLDQAKALDRADPLAGVRTRFRLTPGIIYLDGNSLGVLPADTPTRIEAAVARQWGEGLVRSWNDTDWIDAPRRIGDKIAALIGAAPGTTIATDGSTSTALYKLVVAAAALGEGTILTEADNFPTDAYVAGEAARLLGRTFQTVPGAEIEGALAGAAVAIVTHVNYRTGARHDMAALERAARRSGTRIIWDLSHSAGAVPLALADDGATLAIGCGYKYLNGGPGAPAYLHVAAKLQDRLRSPIAGWWGHAAPFAFADGYAPAPGIDRFLGGTPQMLSLLALESGIDAWAGVDRAAIWRKSAALYDLFADRIATLAPELEIVSPADPARRGSQIALAHPQAYGIVQALIERGVIGDYRDPGIARFGLTPLYLGFADIWRATELLADVMRERAWQSFGKDKRARVT